ncbi:MAG: oxygen-independent coproporphyrinogen III oxidase [Vicinamibacterales bacterium]|nr:oxygen-independent coproporphyrinogen III oxidase [Vicinamibacterales bacterium]
MDPQPVTSAPGIPAPWPIPRDQLVGLIRAYDRPGPRYTSYPTAVEFHAGFGDAQYRERLALAAAEPDAPLSLYLHLPFCEERCTFCGCMVIITRKRDVAARYLDYVERELAMLAEALGPRRRIAQYHWGGGTPTYITPDQMVQLHAAVSRHFTVDDGAEMAIEVDPRVTTTAHIDTLRRLGFNRLSMGVQDFTPEVQIAVNRVQSEPDTRRLYEYARAAGFTSINIDMIYGLPFQTVASFGRAVDAVIAMRPDRLAVYSFALVPWVRAHQKGIDAAALPDAEGKIGLFLEARERLLDAGYVQIGMDHFALPGDEMARAAAAGVLHRNFMGYTVKPASDMVGVGVSSIGDVAGAFAQSAKKLSTYYAEIDAGRFPVERGFVLDDDDRIRRYVITQLMCNFRVHWDEVERRFAIDARAYFAAETAELQAGPAAHGFVRVDADGIDVLPRGRLFVRNVCMVFDRYLQVKRGTPPVFSRTV